MYNQQAGGVMDLRSDHLLIDNLETITYTRASGSSTIENVYKLEEFTEETAPSGGVYQNVKVEFQLPSPQATAPEIDDKITTADGTVYTVIQVREPFLNDFWGCEVVELHIDSSQGLNDVVGLWRASVATDSYGSRITTHPSASVSDIQAKIQLMPSVDEDRVGQRSIVQRYEIFIDLDISDSWCGTGDLIKDASLNVYTITSWKNRDRIDELSVIIAEVV